MNVHYTYSLSRRYPLRILLPVRDDEIALRDGTSKVSSGHRADRSSLSQMCARSACLLRPGDSLARRFIVHEEENNHFTKAKFSPFGITIDRGLSLMFDSFGGLWRYTEPPSGFWVCRRSTLACRTSSVKQARTYNRYIHRMYPMTSSHIPGNQ